MTIEEVEEDAVDEVVRQMNPKANELHDRSRASLAHVSPDAPGFTYQFPAPKRALESSKSRLKAPAPEHHLIPARETPSYL